MVTNKKIQDYFQKTNLTSFNSDNPSTSIPKPQEEIDAHVENQNDEPHVTDERHPSPEGRPAKISHTNVVDTSSIERDPRKRKQIWEYTEPKRAEIRKTYIKEGPYQWESSPYPFDKNRRRFQSTWFKQFPNRLEYSPTTDGAYCLPCFLFAKPSGHPGATTFSVEGFRAWKKVNDGENRAFLTHIGKDPNSSHKVAFQKCHSLMNPNEHIDKVIEQQCPEEIKRNRLCLQVLVDAVRLLTFQHCPHDESVDSLNRGNFIEYLKSIASYNKEVKSVILENAPGNASYTSPQIQKEILSIYAGRIKDVIREEIGDQKFCIIVDETKDISKKEQMAIVLRFVDKDGYIQERFFDLVHVMKTNALTLKKGIEDSLSRHNLNVQNIRGQEYDGASNMQGEWAGLQALFLSDCPYSYYVRCFAHRLQLALVAASMDVISVQQFFSKLTLFVNIVTSSAKRHDQLQAAHIVELERLMELDSLQTGRGLNQVGTIKRVGNTQWVLIWLLLEV